MSARGPQSGWHKEDAKFNVLPNGRVRVGEGMKWYPRSHVPLTERHRIPMRINLLSAVELQTRKRVFQKKRKTAAEAAARLRDGLAAIYTYLGRTDDSTRQPGSAVVDLHHVRAAVALLLSGGRLHGPTGDEAALRTGRVGEACEVCARLKGRGRGLCDELPNEHEQLECYRIGYARLAQQMEDR